MSSDEESVDVIIVGAGLAGLSCAYEVAKSGLQVAVVERGDAPGAKNLSGGRLYLDPIKSLGSDFLDGIPFEREVVSDAIVLTHETSSLTFRADQTCESNNPASVTVLRNYLDQYLAKKVEDLGGLILPQQRVDSLIQRDTKVKGVKIGSDELHADVVVAADGVLSFLAHEAGLQKGRNSASYGIGIKELIALDSSIIEDRFQLELDQGASRLFMGHVTQSIPGGGFIYTNKDSVSIGLVINIDSFQRNSFEIESWNLLEYFKKRPEVAPLLDGGSIVEYGAHLIPEGGFHAIPSLGCNGLLLVGDAAGFVVNSGMTLRGMDLAVASGLLAGQSIIQAKESNIIETVHKLYSQNLEKSFVYEEMKTFKRAPQVLKNDRIYDRYAPELVNWALNLFKVTENGKSPTPWNSGKKLFSAFGWQGMRDLWRILRMGR